jgi:hypothetical protein
MPLSVQPGPVTAGNPALVTFTFEDALVDEFVDPTSISLTVANGDFTTTTYVFGTGTVIVRQGPGDYYAELDTTNLLGSIILTLITDPDGTVPQLVSSVTTASFVVRPQPTL